MEDFGALLDAHVCTEFCSRSTHSQAVLVEPEDVATFAAELAILIEVRDRLAERGFVMREGEPTPRFEPSVPSEPKPWAVRYDNGVRLRRGLFSRR